MSRHAAPGSTVTAREPARRSIRRYWRSLFGDDRDTIRELFAEFVAAGREMLAESSRRAARSGDRVMQAGHKLKGSSRTAGAAGLAEFGAILEEAGKAGDWQRIDGVAPRVAAELQRVERYVEDL